MVEPKDDVFPITIIIVIVKSTLSPKIPKLGIHTIYAQGANFAILVILTVLIFIRTSGKELQISQNI